MCRLVRIKKILGLDDDSNDEVISLLLKRCEMWVRTVCAIFDTDKSLELIPLEPPLFDVVEELCLIRYNKLGSEGLSTETVGPLSMDYCDLPAHISAILNKYKRIKF